MTREQEFELIKTLIEKHYDEAECGLFDCRNVAGDSMENLHSGKYFELDICFFWSYFEVFGTTEDEFGSLCEFYEKLKQRGEQK